MCSSFPSLAWKRRWCFGSVMHGAAAMTRVRSTGTALFLASRESAELRAETLQMGYSLVQLLTELGETHPFQSWDEVAFPTAFAFCAMRFGIEPRDALIAYLWAWAENQVIAALKAIPLGQSAGQRVLLALGPRLVEQADRAAALPDEGLGNMAPGLALLSANHETQSQPPVQIVT